VNAKEWAARIADGILARAPVNKASGGTALRRDLVKMLMPLCEGLVALQDTLDDQGRQLDDLAARNWREDGPALPYPAGRVQPFMPGMQGPYPAPAGGAAR
jgi:hypothetical protein